MSVKYKVLKEAIITNAGECIFNWTVEFTYGRQVMLVESAGAGAQPSLAEGQEVWILRADEGKNITIDRLEKENKSLSDALDKTRMERDSFKKENEELKKHFKPASRSIDKIFGNG